MKRSLLIAAAAAAWLPCAADAQPPVWGQARAQDGDSLLIEGKRVRLFGIDAPELSQTCTRAGKSWSCGKAAASQLTGLIAGRPVLCMPTGVDQYGRLLARCTAGALDINRAMVASGYAIAYRHYALDYADAEDIAKARRLGLWSGEFEAPSAYRHPAASAGPAPHVTARRAPRRAQAATAGGCMIKGNRNRRGQWIYHLPGMPYYESTRAEEMFCTEQQARAAGYRRAIVR